MPRGYGPSIFGVACPRALAAGWTGRDHSPSPPWMRIEPWDARLSINQLTLKGGTPVGSATLMKYLPNAWEKASK